MEYKSLAEIYHRDKSSSRDARHAELFQSRINAESTFRTGFSTLAGELFICVPSELSVLSENVLRTERMVSQLLYSLPTIVKSALLRSLVLDEVVSTNSIEDIHSTKRQIKDVLDAIQTNNSSFRRFKELATLYLNIIDGDAEHPKTPSDIRRIYDLVMDGELPKTREPDGVLFRKEGVDVVSDNGSQIIHRGLEPEGKIIEAVESMLVLASNNSIPSLYRSIAAHYIFEYVHPFYDGNGRTGRYLLSLMLSDILSPATTLSLSRTIAENRRAYYKAFKSVEDVLNKGELTFFIYELLSMIQTAQTETLKRLERCEKQMTSVVEALLSASSEENLKTKEQEAVLLLMQYEVFGFFGDASLCEIAEHLHVGKQMARKHMEALEEKGIVIKRNLRNPISFALSESFKSKYSIGSI